MASPATGAINPLNKLEKMFGRYHGGDGSRRRPA